MMLRVFIGYDGREATAFHVFQQSLLRHASQPLAIIPLVQTALRRQGLYWREKGPTEATEFSMTRFLVPYLSGYTGFSVFADCDMLALADMDELMELVSFTKPVAACQHEYVPRQAVKMDGIAQTQYPCKNWSSFMVFNNAMCGRLTPRYVNEATGADLHRFAWCGGPESVQALPLEWNWLVGEYEANPRAKILHYTNGGPWFKDYADCDHADEWRAAYLDAAMPGLDWDRSAWMHYLNGRPSTAVAPV